MSTCRYLLTFSLRSPPNHQKQIFTHVTCATDSDMMKFVFDACREIILQEQLKQNGFY